MLQRKWYSGISVFFLFTFVFGMVSIVYGSGFGIFTQSASSLGQGSAVVAHTDSPSTIFFNPAMMNSLSGTQVELGTTLLFPSREFRSESGSGYQTKDEVFFPSTFYITHQFNDKVSAGLGVFNPFGLGTDWGETWEGRYLATKSEMETFNINPSLSLQVLPGLSIAAGLDILILDATLSNKINIGIADIGQKFSGDGTGVGFNVGIYANLNKDVSVGVGYRSEIEVEPTGQVTFDTPLLPDSGAKTKITLPQQVFAGIAYKGFDRLTLEAGMRWEGWSSFKELKVDLDSGLSQTQARNWKDTFAINFGANYRLNDTVSLLGGYLYGQNPVPDSTFEPAIPDSDTHLFCVGTDLNFGKMNLALAYAYQLQDDRSKNNGLGDPFQPGSGTANGKYSTDIHLLALSVAYKF